MHNLRRTARRDDAAFEDVVRTSLDCACIHDIDGRILSANAAFARVIDAKSESDLVGTNIRDILDPRVADQFPAYLETILWDGAAQGMMRVLTRTGEVRKFEYRNVLRRTKTGAFVYGLARDMTNALRATRRLAESERRFRTLFERSLAAVTISAPDGTLIDANEMAVRLLRAPSREALLRTSTDRFYAHSGARAELIERLRAHGQVTMREVQARCWDGSPMWVMLNCGIVDFGRPHGEVILTTAFDITLQKKAEEAAAGELRRSENDYLALFAHAHEPILVLEPHTERVLDANDAACRTYGVPKDEILKRTMFDFSQPDATDYSAEVLAAGGRFVDFETVQFHADGTLMQMEISAGATQYRQKPAILSINRDVTEKRRIEQERQQAYATISAVAREWTLTFDAVPNPIVVADETLRIRRANVAASAMLNREAHELIGLQLDQLRSEPWQTISAICRHGVDVSVEVVGGASERIWDVSLSVRRDDAMPESRYIIILRDVTATHELQKSLLRVETMSAMGSLVAGVLHEVRNPLFSISATVDVLEARGAEGTNAKYIERLRNDVGRLRGIMSDLLEYGRPHVLNLARTSLHDLLASASAECMPLLDAARVKIEVEPCAMTVCVDADRMRQVFHNLIENAVQHSPREGTVRVSVREESRRGSSWVVVSVEDEGAGFAPSDLRQVFEPFFTRRSGGTGLGLSIVLKIVEEHGGSVDAANRPEGGAAVSVALRL